MKFHLTRLPTNTRKIVAVSAPFALCVIGLTLVSGQTAQALTGGSPARWITAPEPFPVSMIGLGLALIGLARLRKRKKP